MSCQHDVSLKALRFRHPYLLLLLLQLCTVPKNNPRSSLHFRITAIDRDHYFQRGQFDPNFRQKGHP